MNTSQRIGRRLLGGLAITGCLIGTAFAQEDDIVGTWDCGLTIEDPESGAAVRADFETTYDSDGSYARDGQLDISIAALQLEISVGMNEAGNWRVVDASSIGETTSEIKISALSETPSQMEQMIIQQMQSESTSAVGQEEVSAITSLTADVMELSSADGAELSCNKA